MRGLFFYIAVLAIVLAAPARAERGCDVIRWTPALGPHQPMISIVIDDMGVAQRQTQRALGLPSFVTFAFLPYAPKVDETTRRAIHAGHDVIVHMPMQAQQKNVSPGPDHLSLYDHQIDLHDKIVRNLSHFHGYVGVNNHMGSAFTRDIDAMGVLMAELKKRDLFFLDSMTTPGSAGARAARLYGVPYISREIFIDHVDAPEAINAALKQAERLARKKGTIVMIGHPRPHTLDALEQWIPAAQKRGIVFITLSDAVRRQSEKDLFAALNLSGGGYN
jgi:hypothetical protein